MALCPLCRQRKAKRQCPAHAAEICAVCCGTKRLVEIACPPQCSYLQSAERHPPAVVKRQQVRDLDTIVPTIEGLSEPQLHLLFGVLMVISKFTPTGFARLLDADVAEAASALAATYETSGRGIVYEHTATSAVAEELRRELVAFVTSLQKAGSSRLEREMAVVLRAVERGARQGAPNVANAGDRAYLEAIARIVPKDQAGSDLVPDLDPGDTGLIIP